MLQCFKLSRNQKINLSVGPRELRGVIEQTKKPTEGTEIYLKLQSYEERKGEKKETTGLV